MFCLILECEEPTGGKDFKQVHWLAVYSFFEYIFPEQLICVLKPYNQNNAQAKVFFKDKVSMPEGTSQVEIDNCLATIVDCEDEGIFAATRTRIVHFLGQSSDLVSVISELTSWLKVRVNCVPDVGGTGIVVSVTGCHEEVVEAALDKISQVKCRQESINVAPGVTGAHPPARLDAFAAQSSWGASATDAVLEENQAAKRPRKPLFPAAVVAAAAAAPADNAVGRAAESPRNQQHQQRQPESQPQQSRVFSLGPNCRLTINRCDLTSVTDADLIVATTNATLSLRHGLANAVATRAAASAAGGFAALEADCQRHLKSLRGGAMDFGDSFLSQRAKILFLVLPNDRRLEGILGKGQEFRRTMDRCLDELMTRLVRLAPPHKRVAMPTLGSTLPMWGEDSKSEWADSLAGAVAKMAAGGGTGDLQELRVCCVNDDAVRLLGDAVARQLPAGAARSGSTAAGSSRGPSSSSSAHGGAAAAAGAATATANMDVDDNAGEGDSADVQQKPDTCCLCAEDFAAENPPMPFHCDRDGTLLCRSCVSRLTDPNEPSDGKCVLCFERYRPAVGCQPAGGTMTMTGEAASLPGHDNCGTIVVRYDFDSGTHQGQHYKGTSRTAFFPDNKEGQSIVQRLHAAFDGRVVFNLGASATTGKQTAITWNTVHHKTGRTGGPQQHGYPDAGFLKRISDELSALGY